ncbi:MAG: RNase adapter RapZ [Bryobacterales bacterium]
MRPAGHTRSPATPPLGEKIAYERERLRQSTACRPEHRHFEVFNPRCRRLIVDPSACGAQSCSVYRGFGFQRPTTATSLFDVQFTEPALPAGRRGTTGKDDRVIEYLASFPQTEEFIQRVSDLLIYLIPHYVAEGKSYTTVTSAHRRSHRSVRIAEEIFRRIEAADIKAKLVHRDIHKPV